MPFSEDGRSFGISCKWGGANYSISISGTSPAPRKASVREVVIFLTAQGQVGFPAAMGTGASSRFPSTGSQGARVAMNLREAGNFVLIPFAGTTPRARTAPQTETAQRATVGHRACCTRAGHAAVPPMYALGTPDGLKLRGAALWMAHGPRAPRRWAVCSYARANGQLSKNWDWAAQPLYLSAPAPLFRATPSATPSLLRDTSPIPSPKSASPAPEGNASNGNNDAVVAIPAAHQPVPNSPPSQPGLAVPEIDHLMVAAKRTSASTLPPPVPSPSAPFTVNLSESAPRRPKNLQLPGFAIPNPNVASVCVLQWFIPRKM